MFALQEDILSKSVEQRHFDKALTVVSPRISDQLIQFYQNYHQTSGIQTVWKPCQTQLQSIYMYTKYPQKITLKFNHWSTVWKSNQTSWWSIHQTTKCTQWSHLTSGLQFETMLDTCWSIYQKNPKKSHCK